MVKIVSVIAFVIGVAFSAHAEEETDNTTNDKNGCTRQYTINDCD